MTITCSQISYDEKNAVIFGSEGKIVVHDPWYKPTKMTLYKEGEEPKEFHYPLNNFVGYEFEAFEVMDCIDQGKLESEVMPLDETLEIMKTLDEIRSQWKSTDVK